MFKFADISQYIRYNIILIESVVKIKDKLTIKT